ncbi:uncharacterized protein LOC124440419, partial [Xenia sp. Carnegie-2017]|uniref:uncharacterized protein LOC124440419 n=1 Tax=Xenia sp. Carnegie-2017 TaxID=2897299 RepID=UPI001F04E4F3
FQYGSVDAPGKSCYDIFTQRSENCRTDGIYWISINQTSCNAENAFPVFCDMKSRGFTMAFKVVSGENINQTAGKFWKQDAPSEETSLEALNKLNLYKKYYKNRIVTMINWSKVQPKETVEQKSSCKGTQNSTK